MIEISTKSLDDLERGIKQILLNDRCSFSDYEISLLNDGIRVLQAFRISIETEEKRDLDLTAIEIIEILIKVFVCSDHFRHFF